MPKPVERVRKRVRDQAAKEERKQRSKTLDEAARAAAAQKAGRKVEYIEAIKIAAAAQKAEADKAAAARKAEAEAKRIAHNQKVAIDAFGLSDSCKCGPAINR